MAKDWMIEINNVADAEPDGPQAQFVPAAQPIGVGDTITWRNNTDDSHWPAPSAADKQGWMNYEILAGGTSFQAVTFGAKGTYNYVCALHPDEMGEIQVS